MPWWHPSEFIGLQRFEAPNFWPCLQDWAFPEINFIYEDRVLRNSLIWLILLTKRFRVLMCRCGVESRDIWEKQGVVQRVLMCRCGVERNLGLVIFSSYISGSNVPLWSWKALPIQHIWVIVSEIVLMCRCGVESSQLRRGHSPALV